MLIYYVYIVKSKIHWGLLKLHIAGNTLTKQTNNYQLDNNNYKWKMHAYMSTV